MEYLPPDSIVIRRTRFGWSAFSGDNISGLYGDDGLISSSDDAGQLVNYVLTLEPSQVIVDPEPEQDLRAHCQEFHPRITLRGQPDTRVAASHASDHFKFGSHSHHHGPNAGPHARPVGWQTGGNVTRIKRKRLHAYRDDGTEVQRGDTITDFRGNPAVFHTATRAPDGYRSGKIQTADEFGPEYYAEVFGLNVREEA